jgi:hypothetical protein
MKPINKLCGHTTELLTGLKSLQFFLPALENFDDIVIMMIKMCLKLMKC